MNNMKKMLTESYTKIEEENLIRMVEKFKKQLMEKEPGIGSEVNKNQETRKQTGGTEYRRKNNGGENDENKIHQAISDLGNKMETKIKTPLKNIKTIIQNGIDYVLKIEKKAKEIELSDNGRDIINTNLKNFLAFFHQMNDNANDSVEANQELDNEIIEPDDNFADEDPDDMNTDTDDMNTDTDENSVTKDFNEEKPKADKEGIKDAIKNGGYFQIAEKGKANEKDMWTKHIQPNKKLIWDCVVQYFKKHRDDEPLDKVDFIKNLTAHNMPNVRTAGSHISMILARFFPKAEDAKEKIINPQQRQNADTEIIDPQQRQNADTEIIDPRQRQNVDSENTYEPAEDAEKDYDKDNEEQIKTQLG